MKKSGLFIALLMLFQTSVFAASDDQEMTAVKASIKRIMPSASPDSVMASPVPGLYEIIIGAKVLYMSKDGKFLIEGDVFELTGMKNLTEGKRTVGRMKAVSAIDESTMITFTPEKEVKHTIKVFTDIDCGYCRKLHREMDAYLAEGIEIKYLAYPRSGKNTPSYHKAVGVWCADDKKAAMTKAKNGGKVATKEKCDNPVDEHMAVAEVVGVTGTPTLVFSDGRVIPGYLPAKRLSAFLKRSFK